MGKIYTVARIIDMFEGKKVVVVRPAYKAVYGVVLVVCSPHLSIAWRK
jgi:hypothetical protein